MIYTKEIDPSSAAFPTPELLGYHKRIGRDHLNRSFENTLQVWALSQALLLERRPFYRDDLVVIDAVYRHRSVLSNEPVPR